MEGSISMDSMDSFPSTPSVIIGDVEEIIIHLENDIQDCQSIVEDMRYMPNDINVIMEEFTHTRYRVEAQSMDDSPLLRDHLTGLQDNMNNLANSIAQTTTTLYNLIKASTHTVSQLNPMLRRDLLQYKKEQKLAQIGGNFNNDYVQFDKWFQRLFTCLCLRNNQLLSIKQQALRMQHPWIQKVTHLEHEQLLAICRQQLIQLIHSSLLITKQPPPIIMMTKTPASDFRKGARPPCSPELRLLGIGRIEGQQPIVKCYLMEHEEAAAVKRGTIGVDEVKSHVKLANNDAVFEQTDNNGLATKFHRMIVPKRIDASDKQKEKVTTRKYYFVFVTTLSVFNIGSIKVMTYSLPVALLSHPKQEKEQGGDAHIFWELAFSPDDGVLQVDQDSVPIDEIVIALNYKFVQYTGAKRGLHPAAINHLRNKLLRIGNVNGTVSKEAFFIQEMNPSGSEDQFTFREWFYSLMDMIKSRDGLIHQWNAGLVYGFMDRQTVEEELGKMDDLTLIVKFSDSRRELLISYGCRNQSVQHVLPLSDDMPDIGPIPLGHVAQKTEQLRNVRWIYGVEELKELSKLWTVPEDIKAAEQTNAPRHKKSSTCDSPKPKTPYHVLSLCPRIEGLPPSDDFDRLMAYINADEAL